MNTPAPTPAKPGFLSGFNLNSVLLLILIVLVVFQTWGGSQQVEVQPVKRSQKYFAVNVDREKMATLRALEFGNTGINLVQLDSIIPPGTEYVGQICNDGMNGCWILVQLVPKKP